MSEDNVELVFRATDAYNRGDLDGSLEALGARISVGLVQFPPIRGGRQASRDEG